jgi:hypothetical protein
MGRSDTVFSSLLEKLTRAIAATTLFFTVYLFWFIRSRSYLFFETILIYFGFSAQSWLLV